LVSVGVVALDGSLLAGNASPGAARSYASIRAEVERMLAEAAEADVDEDARLGGARGDELPAELVDARSQRERCAAARSSWSVRRPTKKPPIRPSWPGEPPGRPRTGADRRVANRPHPIAPRSPRGRSTRPTRIAFGRSARRGRAMRPRQAVSGSTIVPCA
jgi:hypothetical protein